jgi:two-component system phosphate regulon sensor histidine kinase PhoR
MAKHQSSDGARRPWLTWVTLTAIIVAVVVLLAVTFRTTLRLDALRAQAVLELTLEFADEKVDRVDRAIIEADEAIRGLADATSLGSIDGSPRRWRAQLTRQTPTISHVLVLDGASTHEVVAFASRAPSPADDAFRRLLLGRIAPDLELSLLPLGQIKHLHKAYDGAFTLLTYWRAQALAEDGALVERLVIVRHDLDAVARELLPQVVPELRSSRSRVSVIDDEGRVVFGAPLVKSDLVVSRRFPTTLYAWQLSVASVSSDQLAGQVRRRRVLEMSLLVLAGAVALAGVIVLLFASAQERRLAAARADFVANVSHELKTPLALVRMFGEMLESGRVSSEEKRAEYLTIIVRESERLSALIENVLDFARVERGKAAYDLVPADVGPIVTAAVEACRTRADTDGVRLVSAIETTLPFIPVDAHAFSLLVINLVDNAIKYAPGTDEVRVEVDRRGDKIRLAVIDHGPGIPPEERGRVFERFFRGGAARERRVRGSGIGLSLVLNIAEAHRGRVRCDETPGGGATFVVELPL